MILLYQDQHLKATEMTKITVSAAGGAMPRSQLSRNNLIDEETGRVNWAVLKGLARLDVLRDNARPTPRSLRSTLRYYKCLADQRACGWRIQRGLPVEMVTVTPYGKQRDGVRRSAF